MAFQVSPGVNVSEIDLTTIVPAVATALGGIAGEFEWGPSRKVILVDSPKRFRETFGEPKNWNYEEWLSATNFLGYSNALQVVRVVHKDAKNAANSAANAKLVENEDLRSVDDNGIIARYPGEKGNSLGVSIFAGPGEETTHTLSVTGGSGDFEVGDTVFFMDGETGVDGTVTESIGATDGSGVAVVALGTILSLDITEDSGGTMVLGSLEGNFPVSSGAAIGLDGTTANGASLLNASVAGTTGAFENWTWSNQFGYGNDGAPESTSNIQFLEFGEVTDANKTDDQMHVVVYDEDGLFTGSKGTVLERFSNLSIFPEARREDGESVYYKSVINNSSKYIYVGGKDIPTNVVNDISAQLGETITLSGNGYIVDWGSSGVTDPAIVDFSLTGGSGQTGGTVAQQVPSNDPEGYNLFEDTELYDVNLIIGQALTGNEAGYVRQIAETRKDAIAFFSAVNKDEFAANDAKLIACRTIRSDVGSSSYAVIDSGYKYQYDVYNDIYRWVPLNADTAGLVARTEATRDAWFSPAGYTRGQIRNAIKLGFNPEKSSRDEIYPDGVNPIITTPGEGTLLLGDRTALSKPSAFDRINVRRLFIVLEKAIATASKYSLFEFNDAFTRGRFVSLISPFLEDVKARRGVVDFKVVCDESNNTPERIDRNEFWADIYIKPNRSINFIQLNFIATRTGASFEEIGG